MFADEYLNAVEFLMITNYEDRFAKRDNPKTEVQKVIATHEDEIMVLRDFGHTVVEVADYYARYLPLKHVPSYIALVNNNMSGWEQIIALKKKYGSKRLRLRGRGKNRAARLAVIGRELNKCHDLPIKCSDQIAVYLD